MYLDRLNLLEKAVLANDSTSLFRLYRLIVTGKRDEARHLWFMDRPALSEFEELITPFFPERA